MFYEIMASRAFLPCWDYQPEKKAIMEAATPEVESFLPGPSSPGCRNADPAPPSPRSWRALRENLFTPAFSDTRPVSIPHPFPAVLWVAPSGLGAVGGGGPRVGASLAVVLALGSMLRPFRPPMRSLRRMPRPNPRPVPVQPHFPPPFRAFRSPHLPPWNWRGPQALGHV